MAKKKKHRYNRRKRNIRKVIILVEVLILVLLSITAYGVHKYTLMDTTTLDDSKLEIYKSTGNYTNIALFGLDSREGELDGGVQSDCIMVASINNKTSEVNIVSVYRDTLLRQDDGSYEKANYAYNVSGPQDAIAMLNRNLDLDIEKYVSVNFNALADVIDALGGVEIDLTEEEVYWTNGYCTETSQVVGRETTQLEGAGVHNLDGIQATSYCRIRYTTGDDYKRTERQRTVLEQVFKKAKKADIATLNKIVNQVFPQVSTNLTLQNILGMAANAANYSIGETSGFPFDVEASENVYGHVGSYVVPVGMEDQVKQLHKFLFAKEDYEPSDTVKGINNDIINLTSIGSDQYDDDVSDEDMTVTGYDSSGSTDSYDSGDYGYDTGGSYGYDSSGSYGYDTSGDYGYDNSGNYGYDSSGSGYDTSGNYY